MSQTHARPIAHIAAAVAAMLSVAALATACSVPADAVSSSSSSSDGRVSVVASFYPMADFAEKVGGDKVDVTCLVPAGTEPHDWEPSTDDMRRIDSADLLVYNGAGMESWVGSALSAAGSEAPASVCASDGIALRQVTSDEGESSGQLSTDPHVWLAPENAKAELRNIADGLEGVDPGDRDYFESRYASYADQLDDLDREFSSTLSSCPRKEIVVAHQAWGYLCDAYGLTQVGIEGLDPDSEPDARAMARIVDEVRADGVTTVFYEDLVSPKVAQAVASDTGATAEQLNPLEGLTDDELAQGQDYFSVMRDDLARLKAALS